MKKLNRQMMLFIAYLSSVLLAGALLPLAFAPVHFWPLAILSPAYLLWAWIKPVFGLEPQPKLGVFNSEPRLAFLTGFIYGLGMFGVGVSWVFVSIHQFGNTEAPVAALLTAIMITLLALLFALQGYIFRRFFKGSVSAACLLGFPCLWVLFEWIRGIYFTGFPWLFLGYTQLSTPLSGFAPIASVYAVSFAVALSSGALIVLLPNQKTKLDNSGSSKVIAVLLLALLWVGGAWLRHEEWTETEAQDYSVSLVQGNVLPIDKFAQADPVQAARNVYVALTNNHWKSDLIVWPENAIAHPLPMVEPFINELKNVAQANQTTLITGLQTILQQRDYYNSMIALGKGAGIYHKRHLVPFGDYLPLESTLRGLINFFDIPMSNFLAGAPKQALLTAGHLNIAPLICYEVAFPELVRETARDSNTIVTISEDGWFGNSFGPHQHLEIARMRALETGRPLLRATTSGISAIINPQGGLNAVSPQFQAMVLKGSFKAVHKDSNTPWMQFGLMPLFALLLTGFFLPGRLPWKVSETAEQPAKY